MRIVVLEVVGDVSRVQVQSDRPRVCEVEVGQVNL